MTTDLQWSGKSPLAPQTSTTRWSLILVCLAVTVVEGYNLIVYGSIVPLLLADPGMGLNSETVGLAGSAVYVGMLVGATSAGVLGDRRGRQRTLIVAMGLFLVGAVAAGLSVDPYTLGAARLLSGLGVGGAVTTALALSRSQGHAGQAGVIVTLTMAGIPLGGTIAALAGIPILPALGWRAMFFVGAVLTGVILLIVIAVPLEPRGRAASASSGRSRPGIAALFHDRRAVFALVVALAAIPNMFTWYGLNTWLVAVMGDLHYSLTNALLFSFTLTGGAIVGSFITMRWADVWGIAKVGTMMASLTVLGLVGISTGPKTLVFSLVCVVLMGVGGHSTMNLINAATTNLFPPHLRATVLGWANGTSYIGAIAAPTAGGLILASPVGPVGVFILYAVSAALAASAMLALAVVTSRRVATPLGGGA
ncbi:MFS transporter [Microbacterium sp. 22242]|uniref:MFS transporter n=1 Tax=Microbacterium sp. 22242 TaxID=3453896 RepID=UPI003F85F1F9